MTVSTARRSAVRKVRSTSPDGVVITAHPGDFVWRTGGAIAATVAAGGRAAVVCLTFGERGESASLWRRGKTLEEVKAHRQEEAEKAAAALGAEIHFLDAGDYPLLETPELLDRLVQHYRAFVPDVVLTHR